MSTQSDSREGLSPSPPNVLDIFGDEEDSDDVEFEPTSEDQSTDASGLHAGEDESDADFTGTPPTLQDLMVTKVDVPMLIDVV